MRRLFDFKDPSAWAIGISLPPGTAVSERRFVWRLWEADVTLPRGECELVCRAFDSSGAAQPPSAADVWNVRGYLNNSWHRVAVSST